MGLFHANPGAKLKLIDDRHPMHCSSAAKYFAGPHTHNHPRPPPVRSDLPDAGYRVPAGVCYPLCATSLYAVLTVYGTN